jgi:hypothetical protein
MFARFFHPLSRRIPYVANFLSRHFAPHLWGNTPVKTHFPKKRPGPKRPRYCACNAIKFSCRVSRPARFQRPPAADPSRDNPCSNFSVRARGPRAPLPVCSTAVSSCAPTRQPSAACRQPAKTHRSPTKPAAIAEAIPPTSSSTRSRLPP